MARVTRHVRASRDAVFDVLVRPETYPAWLAGCQEIRSVDASWPDQGSQFHHRVGLIGPITIPDSTAVLEIEPGRRLVLEVRARPLIRARAAFSLDDEPEEDGQPVTRITLDEVPVGPFAPLTPVLDPVIAGRNIVSLNALVAYLNAPVGSRSDDRLRSAKASPS